MDRKELREREIENDQVLSKEKKIITKQEAVLRRFNSLTQKRNPCGEAYIHLHNMNLCGEVFLYT